MYMHIAVPVLQQHLATGPSKDLICRTIMQDLKPQNILWMTQSHTWKLIDYGIAALIGAHGGTSCVLHQCSMLHASGRSQADCSAESCHTAFTWLCAYHTKCASA